MTPAEKSRTSRTAPSLRGYRAPGGLFSGERLAHNELDAFNPHLTNFATISTALWSAGKRLRAAK
jgi:hypothetical protein